MLHGFASLLGPRNWALWAILIPQAAVAVIALAGLASSAATALILFLPGGLRLWTAAALALTAVAAASRVFPGVGELAGGWSRG